MTAERKLIPSSAQTAGPYFHIGLEYLHSYQAESKLSKGETVTLRGQVLDSNRMPVSDAMLEFWDASSVDANIRADDSTAVFPAGFRRAPTDKDGKYCIQMHKPESISDPDGQVHAPHVLVMVFARGLLRQLLTRIYFEDESANDKDPVLGVIPLERRHTLIVRRDGDASYRWDVILQGEDETVFFAW